MSLLHHVPVMPVVVVRHAERAVPTARALLAGGVTAMELTLRTPVALDAIRRVAAEVPEMLVGAGTVRSPEDTKLAVEAGARFLVSPGSTPALVDSMADSGLPFLPGVATVSEAMGLLERGITEMKLFPAEAVGGRALLKSMHGPLPEARFCPTGGIRASTAASYLELPNVGCVGGSWLTPYHAMCSGDWDLIRRLAEATTPWRTTA